jgi:hypothetical protein
MTGPGNDYPLEVIRDISRQCLDNHSILGKVSMQCFYPMLLRNVFTR